MHGPLSELLVGKARFGSLWGRGVEDGHLRFLDRKRHPILTHFFLVPHFWEDENAGSQTHGTFGVVALVSCVPFGAAVCCLQKPAARIFVYRSRLICLQKDKDNNHFRCALSLRARARACVCVCAVLDHGRYKPGGGPPGTRGGGGQRRPPSGPVKTYPLLVPLFL